MTGALIKHRNMFVASIQYGSSSGDIIASLFFFFSLTSETTLKGTRLFWLIFQDIIFARKSVYDHQ